MKKLFFSKLSFNNTPKKQIHTEESFGSSRGLRLFSLASRKKLSIKYTAALLAVMIIPMVFGFFTTHLAVNSAKNRILEKNNQAISYIQASVDTDLRAIIEYMLSAANNQELLEFSKKPYSKDFIYQASSAKLFPEPDSLNSLSLISKRAVYFDNSEMVVSDEFVYHISAFFDEIIQPRDISYEQFHGIIKTTSNRRFTNAVECYFGKKTLPAECMMYIQSFPLTSSPSGKLIVFINCRQLAKSFLDSFEDGNSCFFITDDTGSVLYSAGNKELVSAEYRLADANDGTLEIDGKEILYSKKNSTYGNLKYIYAESAHSAVKDMAPLIVFTAIYVLLTLVLCVAFILWFAVKNNRSATDTANISQDLKEEEKTDDEQSVEPEINHSLDEEARPLPILETGEQSARKNIISNILHGEFGSADGILEVCRKNGINFVTDDFCVIYFNLNEIVGPDIPIIKYAISNTVLEIFEPISAVFIDDTESASMAGIVNLKKLGAETEKQILDHLEFLRNFFTEQFAASINVGMGSIVKGAENIPSSYSSARESAKYSILTDSSDVLPYSRIKTRDYYYFYPLETESKLVSAVMNDDFEQVCQIIDHIVESNSMLSFDMYKYLFFDLTATALKIMSHKSIDISHIFGDNSSPFESLNVCKNITELVETTHSVFRKICVDNKGGHSMRKEKLKSAILDFIQKNYTNPNMSLAMVADEFSMNYTYASHFFKDFIGMNFIDYVSDLRVKKASELLRTTTMPIADIASAVGYANSTVLIKIFKKITNTTPGAYRKNIY